MDLLMTVWVFFIGIIIGIIIGILLSYKTAVNPLQKTMKKFATQEKYNQEIMKYYPYTLENFRFLGTPIDGIQFEKNVILFVRFITDRNPRTKEHDHIKTLIDNRNVEWFEFTTK